MTEDRVPALSAIVAAELPYLRRYARALTGAQTSGDGLALATMEALLADPVVLLAASSPRTGLFALFHKVWQSAERPLAEPDSRLSAAAQAHLAGLTPNSREALLLHTIEGFELADIAEILAVGAAEDEPADGEAGAKPDREAAAEAAGALIDQALREMEDSILGKVMIIEDEAIIAMDLSAIVEAMGHEITGIARTRREAVDLAARIRPGLILADIQLADNSSGIDAVNDILAGFEQLPVIFITAFPERLLTGERPEPAFLINKPYTEEQVRLAVSQAMFFASTEPLKG